MADDFRCGVSRSPEIPGDMYGRPYVGAKVGRGQKSLLGSQKNTRTRSEVTVGSGGVEIPPDVGYPMAGI